MVSVEFVDDVPVARIFLALDNPRFPAVDDEAQAIERLCSKEDVLPLARDIVRHGVSPLERFALVKAPKARGKRATQAYRVIEGNRRLCALKLLTDPDLAPARLRRQFEKLAAQWTPIENVAAAVFPAAEDVRTWLDRIHNGPQAGIGRRSWDAEQKQRFYGESKNRIAQAMLDYAQAEGMITPDQRRGKLTTATRFIGNSVFREVLGLETENHDQFTRNRPKADFDAVLKRFITDLVDGQAVTSRMNKQDIIRYARPLASLPGITSERIESEPLDAPAAPPRRKAPRSQPPKKPRTITFDPAVKASLVQLGNPKLESLYHSICSIELEHHTPLICIGVWAFFETISGCAGRSGASFDSYLNKNRLVGWGIPADATRALTTALSRINEAGNTTKHHTVSAHYNSEQLNNDVVALQPVIMACLNEAVEQQKSAGRT